ncbi:hypothetical protein H6F53_18240 [Trichocoleus sp. FACHB-832]|uniref:hypothetical protein n=1 Tax=Trichocoleus sp. FACHB-832 TaxID=2692875 RepID=UPI001687A0DB|nr:hypothetical protein [Trichocoleus sp. FACHB-832]MBD1907405.1 hypothetical protein [Trichocoleus sp. FACHB-832]
MSFLTVKISKALKISTLGKLTAISFILALCPVTAEALPTPIRSSLGSEANSDAGSGFITDIDGESQDGTINPLSVSVSALATSGNASVLTTAEGIATWLSSAQGEVNLFNIGWNTVEVTRGSAYLFNDLGWTYEFLADKTGFFTLDYNITGSGSDVFGLNGFQFFWSVPQNDDYLVFGTSGTLTRAITAGKSYTVNIRNEANISGELGTRNASMDGTFNWKIDTVVAAVPESSSALALLSFGFLSAGSIASCKSRWHN